MGPKSKEFRKISAGSNCPLGCSVRPGTVNKINIAVYLPKEEGCTLRIYEQGSKEPSFVASMEKTGQAPIYSIEVSLPDKKTYEYTFETSSGEFADPFSRLLSGVSVFGARPESNIRSVLRPESRVLLQDVRPCLKPDELVVYKLHVRGFSMEAPGVKHKGTFKGLTEKIPYLKDLGINAILLMPCTDFNELMDISRKIGPDSAYGTASRTVRYDENAELTGTSMRINYWGYGAKSCYFAPKASYAADPGHADDEFRKMVLAFHRAGMEVYMEMDFSEGTSPRTMMEAAGHWALEYHVDGFRFNTDRIPESLFAEDPYLSGVKLFYGNSENYQTDLRRFLKGDEDMVRSAAEHIKRSSEGRVLTLNCISDNNGFTLYDLYSYDCRHNEENHENNRDGREINYSWNCGEEGNTKSVKIRELRKRMQKNALAALLLSQGIPMILAGDEFCNSQGGNNNAYCCDNSTGWVNWNKGKQAAEILEFTKTLIALRKEHPAFHNPAGLKETDFLGTGAPDISFHGTRAWYPDYSYFSRTLGMLINGKYAVTGKAAHDKSYMIIFNMHWESHEFGLPDIAGDGEWEIVLSTDNSGKIDSLNKECTLPARSVMVLVRREEQAVRKPIKRASRS